MISYIYFLACLLVHQGAFSLQNLCALVDTSLCWIPSSSYMEKGWVVCSLSLHSWGKSSGLQPFYLPLVGSLIGKYGLGNVNS